MKKANKIGGYLALAFLIIMASLAIYKGYQIRHHFSFTTGIVTYITPPGYESSGDYSIVFEYKINGEVYHGNNNPNFCDGQNREQIKSLLLGKQFPVVYAVKSPSAGTMLLTQDNADRFKYTLPDSVRYYDSILTCKR
jgi:hypothetical protein